MGKAMVSNLLKNGIEVRVYNRSKHAIREVVELGAIESDSIIDSVQNTDILFTMLPNPEVVEKVILHDALKHMPEHAIWVDSSTVDPTFAKYCARIADESRIRYLEAPVAGTKPHAENAELTYFIGGKEEILHEVRSFLEMMSQKILLMGDYGSASSFKLIVNGMLAQSMLVFAEALTIGEKMGLDRNFLLNTLPNLPVIAPFTKMKTEMIRSGDYSTQFPMEHMHKDLHLLLKAGYEQQQPLFMAGIAKEVYSQALSHGLGRSDFAAVVETMT